MAKKILMTTMSLDIGGAETHIAELCRALVADGYDVTVASGGGVYVETLERAGVKHVTLPLATKNPLHVMKAYKGLKKLIAEEGFDVVHAHARIPAFICGLLSRRMGFRFATTAHGTFAVTPLWKLITNWGEKTLSVSYDIKDYLIRNYGVPQDNISLTVNGIDVERFSTASADGIDGEFDLAPSEHRVLYLSRIDGGTAPAGRTVIDSTRILAKEYDDLQVLVVGGGTDFDAMKALADGVNAEFGRTVITMAGPRTDVHRFCAWPHVAIGVSRAILEIMSAGKPAVLMGTQGGLGVFDEKTLDAALQTNFTCRGYACLTPTQTVDAVRSVFEKTPEERAAMGEFARETVKGHYSISRMAQDAKDMYDTLTPASRYRHGDIVIGGYYGYSNLGDDSLLQVIIDQIKEADSQARITVLSKNPKQTKKAFLVNSVGRFNPFKVHGALKRARVFIFGGGSQLQSVTSSRSLTYYLWLLKKAHRKGVPTVLFANGIGPFANGKDEKKVAEVLRHSSLITLRDSRSFEKLQSMGLDSDKVFLSADPAFLMRETDRGWCEHLLSDAGLKADEGYFVMSLRAWSSIDPQIIEKIAAFCKKITAQTALTPLFIPMQTEKDLELCEQAAKEAGGTVIHHLSPTEARTVIAGARFVCGMRLHLLIYAVAAGVPAIALSYDLKVDAFFADLACTHILSAARIDSDLLERYANEALSENREALRQKANAFKEKAKISIEKTKQFF